MTKLGYGQYIREARKARGMTQLELADRMNTSASTISNLEREQHPPTGSPISASTSTTAAVTATATSPPANPKVVVQSPEPLPIINATSNRTPSDSEELI